jgi:hypothetical protein
MGSKDSDVEDIPRPAARTAVDAAAAEEASASDSEGSELGKSPSPPLQAGDHKHVRFVARDSEGSEVAKHVQEDSQHRGRKTGPCYHFAQTGRCARGADCRFTHVAPECILNPQKYTKYEFPPDENDDNPASFKAAAAEAFALATAARLAREPQVPGHIHIYIYIYILYL